MKKIFLKILAAILIVSAACDDKSDDKAIQKTSKIIMITDVSGIYGGIRMAGVGTITIDWGDGTAVETHTLKDYAINWTAYFNTEYSYNHEYSGTSTHTILVTGENITHLYCRNSQLKSLDVSNNTTLINLICMGQLKSLNVSNNTALSYLDCSGNQLTNLDVSKNTVLKNLNCEMNLLKSLDVSNNTVLTDMRCGSNQLNVEALNKLFETLHSNSGIKNINMGFNPGTSDCDRSIATNKGWNVSSYHIN